MRNFRTWGFFLAVAIVLVVGAVMYLGPSVRPRPPMPNPNGYDDFLAASQAISGNRDDYLIMQKGELDDAIAHNQIPLNLLRSGLSRQCRMPDDYSTNYYQATLPQHIAMHRLDWLLAGEGRFREWIGRTNEAATIYLEGIRFSQEACRGGLLIDKIQSLTAESLPISRLLPLTNGLDAAGCKDVVTNLTAIDANEEPLSDVMKQDAIAMKRIMPMGGAFALMNLGGFGTKRVAGVIQPEFSANQFRRRMTIIAFAARAYELDNGKPPAKAADLVPAYLVKVPQNPFTEKPLTLQSQLPPSRNGRGWMISRF